MIILPRQGQSIEQVKQELRNLLAANNQVCYMFVYGEQNSNIAQNAEKEAIRAPNRGVIWIKISGIIDPPISTVGDTIVAWTITDIFDGQRRLCQFLTHAQASSSFQLQLAFTNTQSYQCTTP